MLSFCAGPVSGRHFSISGLALATLIASLPGLAHAQLSGITQSGSVFAGSTVIDRSPQGMYTQPYSDSATLSNLSQGVQTIATAGVSGASARLTTLVSPNEISLNAYAQATNGIKTFYDPTGSYAIHTTETQSNSSAKVDIRFTLGQTTALSVLDTSSSLTTTPWSQAQLYLAQETAPGGFVNVSSGSSLFGLTSLNAGTYQLVINTPGTAVDLGLAHPDFGSARTLDTGAVGAGRPGLGRCHTRPSFARLTTAAAHTR
jgi:hypothetical protein